MAVSDQEWGGMASFDRGLLAAKVADWPVVAKRPATSCMTHGRTQQSWHEACSLDDPDYPTDGC
jgi:hypothetical protein